ncbi:MAG: diheme cytochrome c [Magnetospirillum sp.]|nr:diheme cytochrome c [Magnetospirillum sp.]
MRILPLLAVLLAAAPALADDDWVPPVKDPLVLKECGGCHMAFQPAFLPARSWEAIMDGLADHFGEDASLPADTVRTIRATLVAGAADGERSRMGHKILRRLGGGTPLRITETPSFERKHRFPDRVWKDPKVVTRSNCPACHTGAEKGWYEDD